MIFMILPVWLLPLLKSVLPAIGGIGSTIAGVTAQERMNRYNDPRRQLQRLNAAGLPFAAFQAGQAGNQSQLPDFGGIQQAGQSLGDFMTNFQQAEQGKLTLDNLKEAGRSASAAADVAESNRDVTLEENIYQLDQGKFNTRAFLDGSRDVELRMKEHQRDLAELDLKMKQELNDSGKLTEKLQAEIDLLLQNIVKGKKYLETQDDLDNARDMIVNKMKEGGTNIWEAFAISILTAMSQKMSH